MRIRASGERGAGSLRLHEREGEVAAAATLHRLIDPDHGERLQEPRVLQRAGIDRFEPEHADQLHHQRFLPGAITVLLDVKDIPQVGPLQWGRISDPSPRVCGTDKTGPISMWASL